MGGLKRLVSFTGGFTLGILYYYYLLKKIPCPDHVWVVLSLFISVILGIGNVVSIQLRCISLLVVPMYCGKAGRGVLKAVVLTYIVAGPITNMGLNAREVVRVFTCSTQLSSNLTKQKYELIAGPLRKTALDFKTEIDDVKDTLSSVFVELSHCWARACTLKESSKAKVHHAGQVWVGRLHKSSTTIWRNLRSFCDVIAPIKQEIEDTAEVEQSYFENNYIDDLFGNTHRSEEIEKKFHTKSPGTEKDVYQNMYLKKLEYRCENQLSRVVAVCIEEFASAYNKCIQALPAYASNIFCWHMELTHICNVMNIIRGNNICDSRKELDPGFGEGYVYLKKATQELAKNYKNVILQYKITYERELLDIQDAKETGERVMHAFEEKTIIMRHVKIVMDIFIAVLFLRIFLAAVSYHDVYLTNIDHDNVYITGYFKTLDARRKMKSKYTLLPLKKMERSKYIDVQSLAYKAAERSKLLTQILKVMLEVVTATTFVMLDRLFYEALDVVRQHAEVEVTQQGMQDVVIEVEGTGMLATLIRKLLDGLNSRKRMRRMVTNEQCLPRPRLMPLVYFVKIYGGYVWILLMLFVNPYTLRLRRLLCSYFYPRREKQRILHLYNDILKKRMKMQKTLRRKAVQAVRAHYLSGENLLSLRMKFPQILGWLKMIPAARMNCLICGETEPRNESRPVFGRSWYSCYVLKCPFVYCAECWREVGERCLACDPSLAELSDVDSLSEEEHPRY